jgi:phage terminase large subunit-like protein
MSKDFMPSTIVVRPPSAPHIDAYKVAVKYASDILTGQIVAGKLLILAAKRFISDLKFGAQRGVTFDRERAQHVVDFFGTLRHSKGEWGKGGGLPFILEPWQVFILANLFGFLRADGTRRFREAHIEVARKNGKALALDTPTPTPNGWRVFGDLAPGDPVFDERGAIQRVLRCTDVMYNHPCYRVTFDDGSSVVADAEHGWLTESRQPGNGTRGKRRSREDSIHTTEELSKRVRIGTEWNHKIRITEPLRYKERELDVAPYAMGVWLGDGDSLSARLTCADVGILERLAERGVVAVPRRGKPEGMRYHLGTVSGISLQSLLRRAGVLGNKHIPFAYLTGSITQRLELMRGLMDTDGCCYKSGLCEFTSTSHRLAHDFQELLRGLGYVGRIDIDRATISGVDCGPKYRIQFWPRTNERVFWLERKYKRQRALRGDRTRKISIVSIEPVASVPVRCIEVSGPSHLFLVGEAMVPTHNTTFMAGIGLYMMVSDDEPGAEVYSIATTRDQSKIVFDEAVRMRKKSPFLASRVASYRNNLSVMETASKFEPQSADYGTADGKNTHCLIADELHQHPTRLLYDAYKESTASRSQALCLSITTAGYDTKGICFAQRKVAENILVGNLSAQDGDAMFAYIACIDEPDKDGKGGDDWKDEACWPKANPNLGVSVKWDYLREAAAKAKIDPTALNSFLCKHLNVWTNQEIRWMPPDKWARCNAAGPLASPRDLIAAARERLKGRIAIGGLDLSAKVDLSAFALVFPPTKGLVERIPRPQTREQVHFRAPIEYDDVVVTPPDPKWSVLVWFWVPEGCIAERVKKDRVRYDVWKNEGYLLTCPGDTIQHEFIYKQIVELRKLYQFNDIAFDSWNAQWIANKLKEDGFKPEECRMGYRTMSEPMKELMGMVLGQKLEHYGDPVLAWNAGNVSATTDATGSIKPDKEKSKEKIDGVVASIMALSRICADPALAQTGSVYSERGIIFL